MLWHGGSGWAHGYVCDDVERFDSLREAKRAFDSRTRDPYYPCVSDEPAQDGGPSAWIFFYDPNDPANGTGDAYPDRVMEFGPRGGVQVTYA